MSAGVTLCFYLVIGASVAVALWISDANVFRSITALVFWPLYLPMLLASQGAVIREHEPTAGDRTQIPMPPDEMAAAIAQVELELDNALRSLNGWAEATLFAEADRFVELRATWRQQAERVREMDRLLSAGENEAATSASPHTDCDERSVREEPAVVEDQADASPASRIETSERSRKENLTKLKRVRQQWHDDLLATLAWVRQLVTMIHLARYTGAPASRAAELVQQIANAVEGLSKGTL